jgi:PRTRC genetic system ThiF family protein
MRKRRNKTASPPEFKHKLPGEFLRRKIIVDVIGCGGNGSQMLNGLAPLHLSLRALGHPEGLHVRAWDPDTVSEFNMGRQLFSPSDIGQFKAVTLVNRLNAFYGLKWEAIPSVWKVERQDWQDGQDFLIGCVDTPESRRMIHERFLRCDVAYWLDLGNGAKTGQVVLGESPTAYADRTEAPHKESNEENRTRIANDPFPRLPAITELFRHILTEKEKDNTPSCSMAGALRKQDLYINRHVSAWALQLLWSFFRQGGLNQHGAFVNLETGTVNPLPIERAAWERMGFFYGQRDAAPQLKTKKGKVK